MGRITLRFIATLATVIGRTELETEASTLKEALSTLITEYGDNLKTLIFDEKGNPRKQIKIYINGKDIRFLNRVDTLLHDRDKILLLPAVTGG